MNVRLQGRLFPLTPSIIRRSATICPMVDFFCLMPFWEMRSRGSRIGLSLFRIMRLYSFMTKEIELMPLELSGFVRSLDFGTGTMMRVFHSLTRKNFGGVSLVGKSKDYVIKTGKFQEFGVIPSSPQLFPHLIVLLAAMYSSMPNGSS